MEYPKMLYREGSEIEHEDRCLDTLIVADEAEESTARADGFASLGEEPVKPARKKAS